ncbi:MAG: signal transduction histidine kinase [Gammaproteobacteria bacterium]
MMAHGVLTWCVLAVMGSVTIFGCVDHFRTLTVEEAALGAARQQTAALTAFRSLYASEVVSRLMPAGVEFAHDYADLDGAAPLPATLAMMLGVKMGEQEGGARAQLYSPYPFPWRAESGGLRDSFARDAWEHFEADKTTPFYRYEEFEGQVSMRYAAPDLMRASCVDCHNNHPDTPRDGWAEGDVRGVLEVNIPLASLVAATSTAVSRATIALVALLGVLGLAMFAFSRLDRAVEERDGLNDQLLEAHKLEAVGRLAAGIAHEINTPTQYLGDNTHFLKECFEELAPLFQKADALVGTLSEGVNPVDLIHELTQALKDVDMEFLCAEIPRAIEQSLEGIERVRQIVGAMKEFSHPGGGEATSHDLNRAIETTITVAKNEWTYVADVVTAFDKELPLVICYPGELNQVILNMIVNAAHAIESKVENDADHRGKIAVSTQLDGEFVEIRIGDTGSGIPVDARAHVFDPFFTTKEVGKGTGQGLSIAHGVITKKHAGTISFETELGVGTTFIIRLPLEQDARAAV